MIQADLEANDLIDHGRLLQPRPQGAFVSTVLLNEDLFRGRYIAYFHFFFFFRKKMLPPPPYARCNLRWKFPTAPPKS